MLGAFQLSDEMAGAQSLETELTMAHITFQRLDGNL